MKKATIWEENVKILRKKLKADIYVKENRILVKKEGHEYPIERAAGGLQSISSLFLLFKQGAADEESIFFIEEPETYAHPEWQIVWASIIANLIEKGLQVFIATHSDYFVKKINN